jgi:DNA (cytosine-5)-methyltransferase 1
MIARHLRRPYMPGRRHAASALAKCREAIETHSANFQDAEHLCANVNNYDLRRHRRAEVLWASPICTGNSPASGRRRRPKGQLDLQ